MAYRFSSTMACYMITFVSATVFLDVFYPNCRHIARNSSANHSSLVTFITLLSRSSTYKSASCEAKASCVSQKL